MTGKIFYILFFCVHFIAAQESIGIVNSDRSSILEIQSENRGILIPRVALEDLNSFSPIYSINQGKGVNSLLIFNTNSIPDQNISPGYYFWLQHEETGRWHRLIMDEDEFGIEPWRNQDNPAQKATDNNQNIFQRGSVAIGAEKSLEGTNGIVAQLYVEGPIRGGQSVSTDEIGEESFAFGSLSRATMSRSFAFGFQSKALNENTVAIGARAVAQGKNAVAIGNSNKAEGDFSRSFGHLTTAYNRSEAVFGEYNAVTTNGNKSQLSAKNTIFQIGTGSKNMPKNALTVLVGGQVGIGILGTENKAKPTEMLDIGGVTDTLSNFDTLNQAHLNRVRIRDLPHTVGAVSQDKIVVVHPDGILKAVSLADIIAYIESAKILDATLEQSIDFLELIDAQQAEIDSLKNMLFNYENKLDNLIDLISRILEK